MQKLLQPKISSCFLSWKWVLLLKQEFQNTALPLVNIEMDFLRVQDMTRKETFQQVTYLVK